MEWYGAFPIGSLANVVHYSPANTFNTHAVDIGSVYSTRWKRWKTSTRVASSSLLGVNSGRMSHPYTQDVSHL